MKDRKWGRVREKEGGGGRGRAITRDLLIVVSPISPGVVGLDDEQRRCTLFVERPWSARNPPFSCEIRPDVSTSRNRRGRRAWWTAGILAHAYTGAQSGEIKTKFDPGSDISSDMGGWNRWRLTSMGQRKLIRPSRRNLILLCPPFPRNIFLYLVCANCNKSYRNIINFTEKKEKLP